MNKGSDQQMYFIVHLQNNESTKKSAHRHFFLFVLEGVYANFISQLQQTVPQMNKGRGPERSGEGLQSNFYKACLSAGTPEQFAAEKPKET